MSINTKNDFFRSKCFLKSTIQLYPAVVVPSFMKNLHLLIPISPNNVLWVKMEGLVTGIPSIIMTCCDNGRNFQAPLLINQLMGIWDIYNPWDEGNAMEMPCKSK